MKAGGVHAPGSRAGAFGLADPVPSREVTSTHFVARSSWRIPNFQFQRTDMRAIRTCLILALAMTSSIIVQSTAFSQQQRGTWEQQRACTPDVWRLCSEEVPAVDRIVACLR